MRGLSLTPKAQKSQQPQVQGKPDGGKDQTCLRPSLGANPSAHVCPSKNDQWATQESPSVASFGGLLFFLQQRLVLEASMGPYGHSITRLLAQGRWCRQMAAPGAVHTEVFQAAKVTRLPWTWPGHCPLSLLTHHSLQGERVWETGQVSSLPPNTAPEHRSLLPAPVLTLSPACAPGLPNLTQRPALPGETSHQPARPPAPFARWDAAGSHRSEASGSPRE